MFDLVIVISFKINTPYLGLFFPSFCVCVCVQVKWQTAWEDEGRRKWHESKMSSKLERAEKQMLALGIKRGIVAHLG